MKCLIFFALATVSAKHLYSRSIEDPVLSNEGRITNGKTAAPGQFKYLVGLSLQKGSNTEWCGGSFIGKNWILSASHCTVGASSVTVYLGTTQLLDTDKVYTVPRSDIITHPAFNPTILKNDISLIRIPTTNESSRIQIVKIPKNNDNTYVGYSVVVAGWGYTSDDSIELSYNLQYGLLKISPGNICLKKYSAYFIDNLHFCVATPNIVSTCYGDSGSPLVLEGDNLQIGVDSFGSSQGCTKGAPIVFTRVAPYRFWIKSLTGIHY